MLNRRAFLSALGAALVGSTLDPERLLWVPGAKKIFIPSVRVLSFPSVGMAIRFVETWDPVHSRVISRYDTLGGLGIDFLPGHEDQALRALLQAIR